MTLKGNLFYSSSDRKMNAQKWYAMGRYAFSLGENKRAYLFFRNETDHDRFANINYRIVPASGVGYWVFDEPRIKLMGEMAAGWEHTDYRDGTDNNSDAALIPRAYFEKNLFANTTISADIVYYPIFEDFSDYRLRSEANLSHKLNEKLALNLSVIDEYDSQPAENVKENDLRLLSSVVYAF